MFYFFVKLRVQEFGIASKSVYPALTDGRPSTMSGYGEYQSRYKYSLKLETGGQVLSQISEMTQKEIQEFVNKSLGLMTSGCEQCVFSDRLFCEKHGRPVKVGETRCEYFKQRPSYALQF